MIDFIKRHFFILTLLLLNTFGFSQELTFMTYNIRLDVASDGENAWPNRKEFLVNQLNFYAPDIFGIQEGLPHQVDFLKTQFPNYIAIGEGREGQNKGEFSAIFINKEKCKVVQSSTFWLSETPTEVSIGWDAALPRICTYALIKIHSSNQKFWIFNTHFDHMGALAREESGALILNKIKELNPKNYPVILMGDFNSEPSGKPILTIKNQLADAREVSLEAPFGPEGTFNAFQYEKKDLPRIDYIFVSNLPKIKVRKYAVLNNSKDLRFPSDHFPVFVKLEFQ